MLDGYKYLDALAKASFSETTCPHCGAATHTAAKANAHCNFCEQYINIPDAEAKKENAAENVFLGVHATVDKNMLDDASKMLEALLKTNQYPHSFYVSALFYKQFSDAKYYSRNYTLPGFMEANANSIRSSLDLTFKWKEYLFKELKLINSDIKTDPNIDEELIFIKFMAEVKLQLHVDASRSLKMLESKNPQPPSLDYARMVYGVETEQNDAEASLGKLLAQNEPNAFYYLAKYLAKKKRLAEASRILQELDSKAHVFMVQELANKIRTTQEAAAGHL